MSKIQHLTLQAILTCRGTIGKTERADKPAFPASNVDLASWMILVQKEQLDVDDSEVLKLEKLRWERSNLVILWMEEILHQLGWLKP